MPESAARKVLAQQAARQAERRREAVLTMLQITEATCRYAASQLSNGCSPDEARQTAQFVAEELSLMAEGLRRLTRPERQAERQAKAVQLAALGLPLSTVAETVGVSERTLARYLRPRSPAAETGRPAPSISR